MKPPKKTSHISCTEMDENLKKHHIYLTLNCVKPQEAPHISCIEMHDTTRLLRMCHETRPIAIEKNHILYCGWILEQILYLVYANGV